MIIEIFTASKCVCSVVKHSHDFSFVLEENSWDFLIIIIMVFFSFPSAVWEMGQDGIPCAPHFPSAAA